MDITKLLLMIAIGGFIGYITNKVAIKMLFRPIKPVKLLFFTIQGVFPKRKDQMAKSLAKTIEEELLNVDTILDKLLDENSMDEMKEKITTILVEKISQAVPPMAKMFLGDIDKMIKDFIDKNKDQVFDDLLVAVKKQAKDKVNIYDLVKERIDQLDFVEFEKIIFGLMNRELRHIEIIGLFLGMIIGFIQYFVTLI